MTEEEICKHLDGKLEEFLLKFDEVLRNKLKEKLYFAGGCIYSLANSQEPRDYDLFMTDLSLMNELVNLDIWKFVSDYALSVGKFQIVHKYYGEPSYCVGQFDFLHNMHYYIPFSNKIRNAYTEEDEEKEFEDFEYLRTNELIFNEKRARDIEGVFLRIEKFVSRGFKISKQTIKNIKSRTTRKSVRQYKKQRCSGGNRRCNS